MHSTPTLGDDKACARSRPFGIDAQRAQTRCQAVRPVALSVRAKPFGRSVVPLPLRPQPFLFRVTLRLIGQRLRLLRARPLLLRVKPLLVRPQPLLFRPRLFQGHGFRQRRDERAVGGVKAQQALCHTRSQPQDHARQTTRRILIDGIVVRIDQVKTGQFLGLR